MATDLPDLADQIDDYICIYEAAGGTMDTLAMFIFFLAILVLFIIWLCKFLYNKYYKTNVVTSSDVSNLPILAPNGVLQNKSKPDDKLRRSEPKEILEKKITTKDFLTSKPSPMRTATGVSAQTPLMRKRLSRKSPGPEITPKRRIVPPPSNVVGPDTVSVTWISQVFRWLYSDLVIVNELLQIWVQGINTTLKSYVEENGVVCEIVRVLPESPPPNLSNIYAEKLDPNGNDVLVTCDCECMPVLQMKTYRQISGKVETSHYKATVSRFKGRLAANIHQLTLKGDMRVEGYPEIKVALNSIGPIKNLSQDETQLQDVISEFVIAAIRDSIYPLDLSVYASCPRALVMEPPSLTHNFPTHYDSMASNMEMLNMPQYQQNGLATVSSGKRLLVKVVKGEGLMQATDPYCVVEMDEPAQKNQTGARQGTSPFWDEHFLFDLSPYSAELLFEVYDRPSNSNLPPKFLGLGLVGIDELSVGMSSSQTLGLQPRPYETETVQGAITVEFVFIEGAQIPAGRRPYKLKEALKIDSNGQYRETQLQSGNSLSDVQFNNHNTYYSDTFSPAKVENGNHLNNNYNNGISNQKSPASRLSNNALNSHSSPTTGLNNRQSYNSHNSYQLDSPTTPSSSATASPIMASLSPKSAAAMQYRPPLNNTTNVQNINNNSPNNNANLTNGTTEKRSRNIFGTLKKKLSRSKSRSKSMDYNDVNNIHTETRSFSNDRGRSTGAGSLGPSLIVPTNSSLNNSSNQSNNNSMFNKMNISRTSSLSEASAISGLSSASGKTFLHEDSTLVLETIENGVKRHFLVPISVAQRPRWRRKGTKLHVYNDHTFVAKHLSGSLLCDVCNRSIPRRPGKQGYECRDCLMKCHKPCHVRAPQQCMNSTILSIEFLKWNSGNVDRFIRKV